MLLKSAWPSTLCLFTVLLGACDSSSSRSPAPAQASPTFGEVSPLGTPDPAQADPQPTRVPETDTSDAVITDPDTVGDTGDALGDPVYLPDLAQGADNVVVGDPGAIVDCNGILPCRWISSDQGFSVTVTDADNIGPAARLMVRFQIDTLYDSSLLMPSSPDAVGDSAKRYSMSRQILDDSSGIVPVAVAAGTPVTGSVTYQHTATDESLRLWALSLVDNEESRTPSFTGLPIAAPQGEIADCAMRLPCAWTDTSGTVEVSILSAGGENAGGRVNTTFSVTTRQDSTVLLDAGSLYVGTDGIGIDEISHTLGKTAGFDRVSHRTFADAPLRGSIRFNYGTAELDRIVKLKIMLFEDSPVPRWNPQFSNVPLR